MGHSAKLGDYEQNVDIQTRVRCAMLSKNQNGKQKLIALQQQLRDEHALTQCESCMKKCIWRSQCTCSKITGSLFYHHTTTIHCTLGLTKVTKLNPSFIRKILTSNPLKQQDFSDNIVCSDQCAMAPSAAEQQ